MRPLKNDLLVEAWDRGAGQNPLGRALTMLACGSPERTSGDLADLSIPERDLELLKIRRMTFGDTLRGFLPCGSCGASLEFETQAHTLMNRLEALRPRSAATWQMGNFVFSLRPANSGDLGAAAAAGELRAARRTLLERCTTMRRAEAAPEESEPPNWEFEQSVIEKFEELHEGAEIILTLLCPACGQKQKAELDVAQFFWAEVRSAAVALLREVHELARAYGWAEAAILQMSATRRQAYLEMAQS